MYVGSGRWRQRLTFWAALNRMTGLHWHMPVTACRGRAPSRHAICDAVFPRQVKVLARAGCWHRLRPAVVPCGTSVINYCAYTVCRSTPASSSRARKRFGLPYLRLHSRDAMTVWLILPGGVLHCRPSGQNMYLVVALAQMLPLLGSDRGCTNDKSSSGNGIATQSEQLLRQ